MKTTTMTFRIDAEVYQALKLYAKERGISLTDLAVNMLTLFTQTDDLARAKIAVLIEYQRQRLAQLDKEYADWTERMETAKRQVEMAEKAVAAMERNYEWLKKQHAALDVSAWKGKPKPAIERQPVEAS